MKSDIFLGNPKNSWRNHDKPHSAHLRQGKGETDRRTGRGRRRKRGGRRERYGKEEAEGLGEGRGRW